MRRRERTGMPRTPPRTTHKISQKSEETPLPQRNEKRTGRGHCKTQSRRRAHRRSTGPPPRGSVANQVRCRWPEPAGRKGGARNALRQIIRSARHSGQRWLMRAWRSTSHARHTKCAKRGAGHAHPPTVHARTRARAGEQWSGCGTLTRSGDRLTGRVRTRPHPTHQSPKKNSFLLLYKRDTHWRNYASRDRA